MSGCRSGRRGRAVERLLVTLDVTSEALDEAARAGCQAILAHHPLVFDPLAAVTDDAWPGSAVARLLREGRSLVVAHTNLDKARGGLADVVCRGARARGGRAARARARRLVQARRLRARGRRRDGPRAPSSPPAPASSAATCTARSRVAGEGTFFGTEGTAPTVGDAGRDETTDELRFEVVFPRARRRAVLDAFVAAHSYEEPAFDVYPVENEVRSLGLGRVGFLPTPRRRSATSRAPWPACSACPRRASPAIPTHVVRRVAVVPGSGASMIDAALAGGVDVLVTGDVKYHDAERAARAGLALIDVPHEVCEGWALARWARRLGDELPARRRRAVALRAVAPPLAAPRRRGRRGRDRRRTQRHDTHATTSTCTSTSTAAPAATPARPASAASC